MLQAVRDLGQENLPDYRQLHRKWYALQGRKPEGESIVYFILEKLESRGLLTRTFAEERQGFSLTGSGAMYLKLMTPFTSPREFRLWMLALTVVIAIFTTLGFAGRLAEMLRAHNLLNLSFGVGFLLAAAAILGSGFARRPRWLEIWTGLGITAVYGMVMVRLFVTPEERTHLFEFGLVALLIYQALDERQRNGRAVPSPALLAIAATALLGWLDEGIQFILPNRVYDLRDVAFNTLAGLMAVTAMLGLKRVRQYVSLRSQSK
ncbi:MAG: hypothetical protein Kow002_02030 [Anaerolineales bacterium]